MPGGIVFPDPAAAAAPRGEAAGRKEQAAPRFPRFGSGGLRDQSGGFCKRGRFSQAKKGTLEREGGKKRVLSKKNEREGRRAIPKRKGKNNQKIIELLSV